MRVHKDGYIQANSLEVWLPDTAVRRAIQASDYLTQGLQAAVGEHLGIEIEGADRVRLSPKSHETMSHKVLIESDWVQPTRR